MIRVFIALFLSFAVNAQTLVPPAANATDNQGNVFTIESGEIFRNGQPAGALGDTICWDTVRIIAHVPYGGGQWWVWTGGGWGYWNGAIGCQAPPSGGGPTPPPSSFDLAEELQALGAMPCMRNSVATGSDSFACGQGAQAYGDNGRAAGWAVRNTGKQGYAHGYQADDRGIDGLEAYAHGNFSGGNEDVGGGSAQTSRAVFRVKTTDATQTPLTTDGGVAGFGNQLRLPDNASYVVQWLVVARDTATGDSRAWKVLAMATRGGVTTVYAPVITDIGQSPGASGWGVSIAVDNYNGAVQLNGMGQAGKSLQWVAVMIDAENVN